MLPSTMKKIAPPPRDDLIKLKHAVLFGGSNQFLWLGLFLLITGTFYTLFDSAGYLRLTYGSSTETRGKIVSKTIHYDDESGRYSTELFYQYLAGTELQRESCEISGKDTLTKTGTEVTVKYATGAPEYAMAAIYGCETDLGNQITTIILFFLLSIALGFGLVLVYHATDKRNLHFLINGIITTGIQKDCKTIRNGNSRAYRYTFEYYAPETDQRYKIFEELSEGTNAAQQHEKVVIYDPEKPESGITFDSIKGGLEIDQEGNISCDTPPIAYLFVPALTITSPLLGYLAYLFL